MIMTAHDRDATPGAGPSDRTGLLALSGLLLIARIVMITVVDFTADDAYITFRYATNLLHGHGLVFNPGEAVFGTSAPLYAIILAGTGFLAGAHAIPLGSQVIGVLADLGTLAILWTLLKDHAALVRWTSCVLWAIFPRSVFIAVMGMETPLVILLMASALFLAMRGRPGPFLLVGVILLMLRIDTLLWTVLIVVFIVARGRRPELRWVLVSAGLLIVAIAAAVRTWGSPFPWPLTSKIVAYGHLYPVFDPIRAGMRLLPFHDLDLLSVKVLLLGGVCAVVLAGGWILWQRKDPLVVMPVFFVLSLGALSFGRTLMQDWYFLPIYFSAFIPIGVLVDALIAWARRRNRAPALINAAPAVMALVLAVFFAWGVQRWKASPGDVFRLEQHRVCALLERYAVPGESVMLEPIGYIGWHSGLYVHDIVGLVSPRVTGYRLRTPGSDHWFQAYVRDHEPSYIILQRSELPANALFLGHGGAVFVSPEEREWFVAHYRLIPESVPAESGGRDNFVIYASSRSHYAMEAHR